MDIIKEIKASFKNGSVLTKLIYINLFLFLGLGISFSIIYLMNGNLAKLTYWFDLPASISILIKKPWTIITYMFTHFKFLHLLFNVLVLYWFGKIFLQYLTQKQLLGVYLTGGIVGAAFFVIAYNIFPVFAPVAGISSAVGASASIMAIIFTLAILVPKHEIRLMLIGKVKIIYLAIIVAAIDIISIPYNNAGGHIAHIGGAAYGVVFALLYKDGKDISAWITKIFDAIINLFKKKRTIKIKTNNKAKAGYRKESDMEYNARKKAEQDEINAILDKVARSGYGSLSAQEKEKLFSMSSKNQN